MPFLLQSQSREAAESLAAQLRGEGREAIAVQADVADSHAVNEMVRQAEAELGPVTLLVNNAGISWQGLFQDMEDAAWDRMLAVNLTGDRNAGYYVSDYETSSTTSIPEHSYTYTSIEIEPETGYQFTGTTSVTVKGAYAVTIKSRSNSKIEIKASAQTFTSANFSRK